MTYPCGIIKDLLPIYIDDVCNEESKEAVENHLSECEKCRSYYETMKSTDDFEEKKNANSDDMKLADSLKNMKLKINKKIRNTVLFALATVVVFIFGFNFLFNAAVKDVSLNDISVSANVYSLAELMENTADDFSDSVSAAVFSNDGEKAETVRVKIPEFGNVVISGDAMKECEYATVVSVSSEYFLRTIKREIKDDTVYISAFKTTILNNKAENYQKTMKSLEYKEINKIVFVDDNGKEIVLWQR